MTDNIILYTIDDSKAKAELYKFDEGLYLVQNAIAKFLPSQSRTQVFAYSKNFQIRHRKHKVCQRYVCNI